MMQNALENSFKVQLEELYRKVEENSHDPFLTRSIMWDHFCNLHLPFKETEGYRYIALRHLFEQKFVFQATPKVTKEQITPWVYPECSRSVLVFVNGIYQESLSCRENLPSKLIASTLLEANEVFDALLSNLWTKTTKEERDPFAILNGALYQDGGFVYIPPNCLVESPIQILQITVGTEQETEFVNPRLLVVMGQHSNARFLFTQHAIHCKGCFINSVAEFVINEGSHVHIIQNGWNDHSAKWHFDALRATLKKQSSLKTVFVTNGSETTRTDYKVALAGEGAEALLNGISYLSDQKESHIYAIVDHQAPHCRSYQRFKNVLNGSCRSSFEGKILVRQIAQKTEAFQLNNNLLLDDRSQAYSKPNLEVFADDVKASHGATIGQLDSEQVFYMKTRGFSEEIAKKILVLGFCEQIFEMIPLHSMRKELSKAVSYA